MSDFITDQFLVDKFRENMPDIKFIDYQPKYDRYGRKEKLLELFDEIKHLRNGNLYQERKRVIDIWMRLLESAIVYLKHLDERERDYSDDAAYGVKKLIEFFNKFSEFEPLLYGAEKEYYRDHVTHMFSVFLLGEYLIRSKIGFDKIVVGREELNEKISLGEKEAMWCIMSLTHDMGYALEGIPRISPKARKMLEAFGFVGGIQELLYSFPPRPHHDLLLKIVSADLLPRGNSNNCDKYSLHTQSKYFLKFAEAFERCDHGIISCLVLIKNLVYFLETDYSFDDYKYLDFEDARQFQIRRDILRPIAGHSCDNIYYMQIPKFDFLLMLIDEMQEWGRPRFAKLFGEEPDTSVTIESFNEREIHYKVSLNLENATPEQKNRMAIGTSAYFRKKCEWLFRTLRSAVVGEEGVERNVQVTCEVINETGEKPEVYKIAHKSPVEVELSCNGKPIPWKKWTEKVEKDLKSIEGE